MPFLCLSEFTLNYFNIIVGIHHPFNREKRSNTFKVETPSKHILDGILCTLINMTRSNFFTFAFSNKPTLLSLYRKWLSTENKTFFQSAVVHSLYVFAHESLFFFIWTVKSYFFCGLVAFLPAKISHAFISTPASDKSFYRSFCKSFCRTLLVFLGSRLLFLKRYASSFAVAFRSRTHFPFRFGDNNPVSLNCLIIRATLDWLSTQIKVISIWKKLLFSNKCLNGS